MKALLLLWFEWSDPFLQRNVGCVWLLVLLISVLCMTAPWFVSVCTRTVSRDLDVPSCPVLCFCPLRVPLEPPGGFSGGQFMIWLWCYNTIGLQWCCSSSLTLLAPPTGTVLPTLLLLLCLWGSALLVAIRQCMGDPWGDGDHGSPFKNGQSPCVLNCLTISFLCQSCVSLWERCVLI